MERHRRQLQGTIRISPEDTSCKPHDYQVKCNSADGKDGVEAQCCCPVRSAADASTIHAANYWTPFYAPQLLGPIR
jgi:hypothetical protein